MSLSALVAALEAENAELRREVELYRAAHTEPTCDLMLDFGLTRQEAEVLKALIAASPRCLQAYAIDQAITHRDHAAERSPTLIQVVVSKLRGKLGAAAIETIHGRGWRINPKWKEVASCGQSPNEL